MIQTSHSKGVCALSFSGSGKLLLSVGVDGDHE